MLITMYVQLDEVPIRQTCNLGHGRYSNGVRWRDDGGTRMHVCLECPCARNNGHVV